MALGEALQPKSGDVTADNGANQERSGRVPLPGLIAVLSALIVASASFAILLGVTPITPQDDAVIYLVSVNLVFVGILILLIAREVRRLLRARGRGRAAARLHIRIVALFSIVAITPAILVAIVASFTLDVGLDRWFSIRTQSIVNSSLSVAEAYVLENARNLQGQTLSMATDLDNARSLYSLDRRGFNVLLTRQAIGRGLLGAFLVRDDGSVILQAEIETERPLPAIPDDALQSAKDGEPTLIPPGVTNLVGAVIKLNNIPSAFLYTVRAVDPRVIQSMRLMEDTTQEYQTLESGRVPLQIAFGVLYVCFALIVLIAAIWAAIAIADRIVRPIRLLINASDAVAGGDLSVNVPVRASDGDVASLARTFNNMIVQIGSQRDEILDAKDQIDDRRRFSEAVLSGVTAGVIGVSSDGRISIVNRSAELIIGLSADQLVDADLRSVNAEIAAVLDDAAKRYRTEYRDQITVRQHGKERTLNVQVTREEEHAAEDSFVITLDDITDLVIAQRSTAWADVARRIAHEIKNPLTPIQLSAERIRRRYGRQIAEDDRQVFDQCTETIVRQVGDIGRMVDEFSAFARMPKPTKESADLRDILKEASFLHEMSDEEKSYSKEFGDEPLIGNFDKRMLGQAFGNLIKNAGEAIDAVPPDEDRDGRRIFIRSRYDKLNDDYVIDVIDNGRGLPSENRHQILEPYMTMREKGTGLGLSIVRKIIDDHGGSLELHDAPPDFDNGHGAMITVRLPKETVPSEETNRGEEQ